MPWNVKKRIKQLFFKSSFHLFFFFFNDIFLQYKIYIFKLYEEKILKKNNKKLMQLFTNKNYRKTFNVSVPVCSCFQYKPNFTVTLQINYKYIFFFIFYLILNGLFFFLLLLLRAHRGNRFYKTSEFTDIFYMLNI